MPSGFLPQHAIAFDRAMAAGDFDQALAAIREAQALGHPCLFMKGELDLERSLADGTYEDFSSGSDLT